MNEIGTPLGILIGIVTGMVFILLVRTAFRPPSKPLQTVLAITGELLALPTFWFGGPWLSTVVIGKLNLYQMASSYILSLAWTFAPIAIVILVIALIRYGNEMFAKAQQ